MPVKAEVRTSVTSITVRTLSWTVFATLLGLIILLPFPYGSVQAWWIALFEVIVFIAAILWIIEGLFSGSWFVKEHRVLIPLAVIVLFALVQAVPLAFPAASIAGVQITRTISADPFETKEFAKDLLAHVLVLAMLLRYVNTRSRLRGLTYVVIGTGMAIAVFGLMRFFLQPAQGGFLLHYLKGEIGFGPYINRNHFSFLMEMALGLIAGLAIFGEIGKRKLQMLLGGGLIIWIATSLSNSRGGIFALVCQVMLGFFLAIAPNRISPTHRLFGKILRAVSASFRPRAATLVAVLIVMVAGTIWIGGEKLRYGISIVPTEIGGDSGKDTMGRGDIWKAGWRLFEAHPIMGSGFGGFSAAMTKYHEKAGVSTVRQAHNDYLEILASGGLIGAALGVWFVFRVYRFVAGRIRSDSGFVLAARWGAIIGLSGVAIHSFVEFGLHVPGNSVVFMALLAISVADVSRSQGPGRSWS